MKEQVEQFMADLISTGFSREQISTRGYEYALALQTDQQPEGTVHVPASMMALAAALVNSALPGAYRIYEFRNRIR